MHACTYTVVQLSIYLYEFVHVVDYNIHVNGFQKQKAEFSYDLAWCITLSAHDLCYITKSSSFDSNLCKWL